MKRLLITPHGLFLAASVLTFILPLGTIFAQGPGLFDAFAARKESPTDPLFAGMSISGYSGIFGLRLSGGLSFNGGDDGSSSTPQYTQYYRCDRYQCRGARGPQPSHR